MLKNITQRFLKTLKNLNSDGITAIPILIILVIVGIVIFTKVFAQTADTTDPVITTSQFSDFYLLVTGTVVIEPTIVDESPIAKVQLAFHDPQNPINGGLSPEYTFVDTETPFQFSWDTTKMPDGRQRFNLKVWDIYGNGDNTSFGHGLMAMNDPKYPPITVSPSPGSKVSGFISIEISTSATNGVAGVYINGLTKEGWTKILGPPYKTFWDSSGFPDGPHVFKIRSFETDRFSPGDLGDPGELNFELCIRTCIQPATISGTIYSSTGQVVSGAKITLRVNNKNTTYTSDAQGKYIIPNLPPGTYQITYVAAGYSQQKTTATVTAGQTLVINITLKPK